VAVASCDQNSEFLTGCLNNAGVYLTTRYEEQGSKTADLEESVDVTRQAVNLAPFDYSDRIPVLCNFGNRLLCLYDLNRRQEDLEEAIGIVRQILDTKGISVLQQARWSVTLSKCLGSRHDRSQDRGDLDDAIAAARRAIETLPQDHPDRADQIYRLSFRLARRYERVGDHQSIAEGVDTARQAVALKPSDLKLWASGLDNLSVWLGRLYERTGEMENIEEAIEMSHHALKYPSCELEHHADRLSNLGLWLRRRYERTREIRDLEESIDTIRQALMLHTSSDSPESIPMINLSISLHQRYVRNGDVKDLDEAVHMARRALETTPPNHQDHATGLNILGACLESSYTRIRKLEVLQESICVARQALQSTSRHHIHWTSYMTNLSRKLKCRYDRVGEIEDLQECIDLTRQAVISTPQNHSDRASRLNDLGSWLFRRYKRIKEPKDLEEVSNCYLGAFDCIMANNLERVRAASLFLCISVLAGKTTEAVRLGRGALALLPIVHTRTLDRSDQQFVLSQFAGIASNLCALLLSEDRVSEAFESLEHGRAVIIRRLLDDKSDLSHLSQYHPKLSQRYQDIVADINMSSIHTTCDTTEGNLLRRRKAAADLEACLNDIRAIPGHERFALGQTVAEMQRDMGDGYVVTVNISPLGSNAIVLAKNSLQVISLPATTADDASRWINTDWRIRRGRYAEGISKNVKFLEYLTWLWRGCVVHILDYISSLIEGSSRIIPRVWWVGCGLASSMPFHAAGIHSPGSQENALSRVISSYTPSFKALEYARSKIKRIQREASDHSQMLIAAMPETPKGANDEHRFRPLDGVLAEKDQIVGIVSPHVITDVCVAPNVDSILDQLKTCKMAHFACHGTSDPTDPHNSGLVLQRVASDGTVEQGLLSVYRISQLQLRHAELAYLSACSTAENKGYLLQDEVIHIVSGFQVAGFPHVVGSLWPAGDEQCVQVARAFYSLLLKDDTGLYLDGGQVALALHKAVMALRVEEMTTPLSWAQFVHFGA
jgi:tetratricopeptide (TPR) repeat protein